MVPFRFPAGAAWWRQSLAAGWRGSLVAGLLAAQNGLVGAEVVPRGNAGVSFLDRFARLDGKRWFVSHGWTNGPHQGCAWSTTNARLTSHGIQLTVSNRPAHGLAYSCGELQTREFYGYGTYEVRMRPAAEPGVVSTFFSYTGPSHRTGSPHEEIDFEFLGRAPGRLQLNYVAAGKGGHERIVELGFDPSATMNDYAFQWTPDAVRWFVNRRLIHEVKRGPGAPFPSQAGKIMLSIWTGAGPHQEAWMGRLQYAGRPLVAAYEHVAFTALGEPCRFPASLLCADSLTSGR